MFFGYLCCLLGSWPGPRCMSVAVAVSILSPCPCPFDCVHHAEVELALHTSAESLYMAIDGKVFDITHYVNKHPGRIFWPKGLRSLKLRDSSLAPRVSRIPHSKGCVLGSEQIFSGSYPLSGEYGSSPHPPLGVNLATYGALLYPALVSSTVLNCSRRSSGQN